ncbi:MAG TPA: hypothetical protein VGI39_36865 [Polyangiaceae bacterium]|jgi:hypothetical protein
MQATMHIPERAISSFDESRVLESPLASSHGRDRRRRAATAIHDDEVIERIAAGDLEAAQMLRTRYRNQLVSTAGTILSDKDEVSLTVDAVLEEACTEWPPERGQVGRWLRRRTRRAAIARRRALGEGRNEPRIDRSIFSRNH